jgi:hypothetical protein
LHLNKKFIIRGEKKSGQYSRTATQLD